MSNTQFQTHIDVSVVVPALNEAESIGPLSDDLEHVLSESGRTYEIILVDDGSVDGTGDRIGEICERNPNARGILLRRNFGKASALQAGFDEARGDLIITLDADRQDDPSDIPDFLAEMAKGRDLVCGWKVDRKDPLSKRLPSKVFNFVSSLVFGVRLHDYNCGFKCYRSSLVREINLYGEMHRFVPILASSRGYRVAEIPVNHHPRRTGRSKYGIERIPKGFFDLLTVMLTTRYFYRPLHYFGLAGLILFFIGGFIMAWMALRWLFFDVWIEARPLFFISILLILLGAQTLSLGLVAEMIVKSNGTRRDLYSVRARVGGAKTQNAERKM